MPRLSRQLWPLSTRASIIHRAGRARLTPGAGGDKNEDVRRCGINIHISARYLSLLMMIYDDDDDDHGINMTIPIVANMTGQTLGVRERTSKYINYS